MPLPSLPDECFSDILYFLDNESLYKCLFVNRYYCKLSIPIIWRDPFNTCRKSTSLVSTLLSCLNEEEISSIIPYTIYSRNYNTPLFEYGKFIKIIDHTFWYFKSYNQKLVDAIYHMIMRTGSSLQEFSIYSCQDYVDLPKFSVFTNYKPGITNLRSLIVYDTYDKSINGSTVYQNAIEFLSMVSKFCNCIINFELNITYNECIFSKPILDIIKLQPLKRVLLSIDYQYFKNILYTLKNFRSETLKELFFQYINFQKVDLSFISELRCLERLEFIHCSGFTFKKKLHHDLKELKLWYRWYENVKLYDAKIINYLCGETLLKLSLSNIVTPETVKTLKESCPNVTFLRIGFSSKSLEQCFDLTIPLICELLSLKTLDIELIGIDEGPIIRLLCNHLMSVEHLFLSFHINLQNFKYFAKNCIANLKRLDILVKNSDLLRKDYLIYAKNNFRKVRNSLKVFGINYSSDEFNWTEEEIEIIDLLTSQGIDVVSSYKKYKI